MPLELASAAAHRSPLSSPSTQKGTQSESVEPLHMDADEDRKPRTIEEMVQEAEWLKTFFKDTEENEV